MTRPAPTVAHVESTDRMSADRPARAAPRGVAALRQVDWAVGRVR